MSHNVSLSGIDIKDFVVFGRALDELNQQYGLQMRLEIGEQAQSRNWEGFGMPKGQTRVLPGTVAVIHTGDRHDYDITLTRGKDGKVTMQTEALMINNLITSFGIDPKLSLDVSTGDTCDLTKVGYRADEALGMKAALGRITQRYSVLMAEKQAALQGHTVRRKVDAKSGVINVVATGM